MDFIASHDTPVGFIGPPFFVPHPPDVGPSVAEDYGFRLQFAYNGRNLIPLVIGFIINFTGLICPAVISGTPVGTIKPYFKNVAIICKQFTKLPVVIRYIGSAAIATVIPVPGRKVYAEFQAISPAGLGKLPEYVAPAFLPG